MFHGTFSRGFSRQDSCKITLARACLRLFGVARARAGHRAVPFILDLFEGTLQAGEVLVDYRQIQLINNSDTPWGDVMLPRDATKLISPQIATGRYVSTLYPG